MDNINRQIKWPPTQITASASVGYKLNKLCLIILFIPLYCNISTLMIFNYRLRMENGTKEGSEVTDVGSKWFQFNLWAIKTSLAGARLGEIEYLLMS